MSNILQNRREFIKKTGIIGLTSMLPFQNSSEIAPLRLGFIGVGLRGRDHLEQALMIGGVVVTAIADPDPKAIEAATEIIKKYQKTPAKIFQNGSEDYNNLLNISELDAVIISTPWQWHTPQAVAAMQAGKYVGLEVPACLTVKEAWELVKTHEKTGTHLMFLENVCYRRDIMAVLNMAKKGLFGEILHVEGGYQHDLREVKFNDGKQPIGGGVEFGEKAISEARWRTQHSIDRNGDLYTTHGLGPVAQMIDINRGNKFLRMTSYATPSRGLHEFIVKKGPANHPNTKVKFKLGDVIQTQIQCENGQTILLTHDTNLPRPYSLGFRVQGTNGIWMDVNKSIYLEGISSKPHVWESFASYQEKYDHPAWKAEAEAAKNAGHGGMDFFVMRDFLGAATNKNPAPIDVYDAAAWSVISPLSEKSISQKNATIEIPDFTSGAYKSRKSLIYK